MSEDQHVRRDGDAYAHALAALLPEGIAWSAKSWPGTVLYKVVRGLAGIWGYVDHRAGNLLEIESDPRITTELLPDWERAWGLPDPCAVDEEPSIGDRQVALVARMTTMGGQSRQFFIDLADTIGYQIDEIREWSPFMVGISRVGDTRPTGTEGEYFRWEIGPPEMRFYWSVKVGAVRLTWFRVGAGGGQTGVDPHLRIALAEDLECMLRRNKPGHTEVLFDYSPLAGPSNSARLTANSAMVANATIEHGPESMSAQFGISASVQAVGYLKSGA